MFGVRPSIYSTKHATRNGVEKDCYRFMQQKHIPNTNTIPIAAKTRAAKTPPNIFSNRSPAPHLIDRHPCPRVERHQPLYQLPDLRRYLIPQRPMHTHKFSLPLHPDKRKTDRQAKDRPGSEAGKLSGYVPHHVARSVSSEPPLVEFVDAKRSTGQSGRAPICFSRSISGARLLPGTSGTPT